MKYEVHGTDRLVGALGIFTPFWMTVEARDEDDAREKVRELRYSEGREHVHFRTVKAVLP